MLVWKRQLKRVIAWLVMIFFSSTVGFVIPISSLFSLDALWKGIIVFCVGALLPKILASLVVGEVRPAASVP